MNLRGYPLIAFVLALLSWATGARGGEIPVATPAELQRALDNVNPADTILLADGDWNDATIRSKLSPTVVL